MRAVFQFLSSVRHAVRHACGIFASVNQQREGLFSRWRCRVEFLQKGRQERSSK